MKRHFKIIFTFALAEMFFIPTRAWCVEISDLLTIDTTTDSRLCGVNSLFIGLNLLNGNAGKYEDFLEKFPIAKMNGTSLFELKTFIETRTNLHAQIAFIDEGKIANLRQQNEFALIIEEARPRQRVNFSVIWGGL